MTTTEGREILVGIDPGRNWYPSLAQAADEAGRRGLGLRIVVAVPSRQEAPQTDGAPGGTVSRQVEGKTGPESAHSARDDAHAPGQPPYLVVGIDGSESSKAALAFALEEADVRGARLRALSVRQPPAVVTQGEEAALQEQRRMLFETTADWSQKYPEVVLTHELPVGQPVEELAKASEEALALVVGRRATGAHADMRLGSVADGLLHRAHCPVIIVPQGEPAGR
ncbi:universal stress protein [Streptomyces sp. NBC_00503]|uniref:universal stress protein n=1 Tax=Streptomyces sp. NBC_00503 TaxID=2903659 RepID=UPI002E8012DB|nr:universal stress protein [Streptomyces sp. NBC_00503]WUD79731.1 universal stress protein [Streptomyces sp. NBC_00503]